MKTSQKKIAQLAGVSRGTVDRVLHGKPNVKPQTKERVLNAIAQLDYSPNMVGRALALSKREYTICVVLPDNPFFSEVKPGIHAAAEELRDYNLTVSYIVTSGKTADEIVGLIDADTGNAFMVAAADTPQIRACIRRKTDAGIPVVTFNTDLTDSGRLCFVGQDLYKSGCIAASLMLKLLHDDEKRVLMVTGSETFRAHNERIVGFCDVISRAKKSVEIVDVVKTLDDPDLTYSRITSALAKDSSIDGIYIASANMPTAMKALASMPRKYRVVANDLVPEVKEALKNDIVDFTIFQNPFEQGYRPIKLLFEYLFNNTKPDREYYYTDNSIITSEMF